MPEVRVHSLAFRPLDRFELSAIRAVARLDRDLESLTASVVRAQFLRATMGGTLGPRGERGLALIEAFLLFLLGSSPADDGEEIRSKAMLFRCGSGEPDNVDAMLCAALEADCLRLGLMAARPSLDDDGVPH